jgi:hypothetical protein
MRTSHRCRCGDSGARAGSSVVEEEEDDDDDDARAPSASREDARARTSRTARRSVDRANHMADDARTTRASSDARGAFERRRRATL